MQLSEGTLRLYGIVVNNVTGNTRRIFHEWNERSVNRVYGIYDLPDWWRVTQPPKRTDDPVRTRRGIGSRRSNSRPNANYLIIHGDEDAIVHHNQSEGFVAALQEKNADVETLMIPGAGHHWFTARDDNPARRRVDQEPNTTVAPVLLRFLEKALK